MTDPLGIDKKNPSLTWTLESNIRGQKQTAYRILVADSKEHLDKDKGGLWDSGKVKSDQSVNVLYGGKQLDSRIRCFWKVMVWDKDGKASKWSKPAVWTMGVLDGDKWNAKWISSPPKDYSTGPALYLRNEIKVSKKVKNALARISALGWAELTIDGSKVADDVLSPAFSDFHQRILYVTYNVTYKMTAGDHALAVVLGNGHHSPPVVGPGPRPDGIIVAGGPASGQHQRYGRFGGPKLLLEIEVEYTDGTKEFFGSDENWKFSTGRITFNDVWTVEKHDLRLEEIGWDRLAFDETNWKDVEVFPYPTGKMVVEAMPPVRRIKQIPPTRIEGNKAFFEHVSSGWPRLLVSGREGQKISVSGRVGDRHRLPPVEYILRGEKDEILEPKFYFNIAPKEMVVKGLTEPLTKEMLSYQVAYTDLELTGKFECSSDYFNQLHSAIKHTHLNYNFGQPKDPTREKQAWTEDVHTMIDSGAYLTDVSAFYRNWWRDFAANQTPDGYLGAIVPLEGLQTHDWNGPWWSGAIVYLPWRFYEYYGDTELLAEAYEPMKRYIDFLGRRAKQGFRGNGGTLRGLPEPGLDQQAIEDGVLSWGTGDWMGLAKPPIALTSTSAWAYYAGIISKTAKILGKDEDAQTYAKLSEDIKQRLNKRFLDPATGVYANPKSQTAHLLPLAMDLVPKSKRDLVVNSLVNSVHLANDHLNTGFLGTAYLLTTLTEEGYADLAAKIVNQPDYPSWKTLMNEGVLKENWKGEHAMMPSLGGPIGAWLYKAVLGIRPDPAGPGFKRIIIKPEPVGDLTWAKGSYKSIRGKIATEWQKKDNSFTLDVRIPVNTTATVYIPAAKLKNITESGIPVKKANGVKFIRIENNNAVLQIESGSYNFVSLKDTN